MYIIESTYFSFFEGTIFENWPLQGVYYFFRDSEFDTRSQDCGILKKLIFTSCFMNVFLDVFI